MFRLLPNKRYCLWKDIFCVLWKTKPSTCPLYISTHNGIRSVSTCSIKMKQSEKMLKRWLWLVPLVIFVAFKFDFQHAHKHSPNQIYINNHINQFLLGIVTCILIKFIMLVTWNYEHSTELLALKRIGGALILYPKFNVISKNKWELNYAPYWTTLPPYDCIHRMW